MSYKKIIIIISLNNSFQMKNKYLIIIIIIIPYQKVPRASLMRGGSQEDPQQLLRDLQDSLEREADLKEQLRFAEEEVNAKKYFIY